MFSFRQHGLKLATQCAVSMSTSVRLQCCRSKAAVFVGAAELADPPPHVVPCNVWDVMVSPRGTDLAKKGSSKCMARRLQRCVSGLCVIGYPQHGRRWYALLHALHQQVGGLVQG
jgi:hypothetical protein